MDPKSKKQPNNIYSAVATVEAESTKTSKLPGYGNSGNYGSTKLREERETNVDSSNEQLDSHVEKSDSIEIENQPDYVFNEDTGVASCIHCLEEIQCVKSHLIPLLIKKHLETNCNPL